jgi:hypothetical protein
MQCVDATDRLLGADHDGVADVELDEHVAGCLACAQVAGGLRRLDSVLAANLTVAPPLDLQRVLAQIALDAARSPAIPWWNRILLFDRNAWLAHPQAVAMQGLAALVLVLASWQVFNWLSAYQPVIGDVGYAMELVASSPATAFISNFPIDLQSLVLWSLVGLAGWLISDRGFLGRRVAERAVEP